MCLRFSREYQFFYLQPSPHLQYTVSSFPYLTIPSPSLENTNSSIFNPLLTSNILLLSYPPLSKHIPLHYPVLALSPPISVYFSNFLLFFLFPSSPVYFLFTYPLRFYASLLIKLLLFSMSYSVLSLFSSFLLILSPLPVSIFIIFSYFHISLSNYILPSPLISAPPPFTHPTTISVILSFSLILLVFFPHPCLLLYTSSLLFSPPPLFTSSN